MRVRNSLWNRLAVAATLTMALAACSNGGPEAQLRADMEEAGFSDASIQCLIDAFDIANISDLEDLQPPPDAASSECVAQVFAEMFAGAFDEAFDDLAAGDWEVSDGQAPTRDDMGQLAEDCRNGDNAACDDLWLVSPIDSPEERLAESCGGRSSEPRMGSCAFWLDD